MYDSKYTEFDIVDATNYKRDPLKELAKECKKQGIKLCVYYSLVDWSHPNFPQKYSQLRREHPNGFHSDPNPNADITKYNTYMRNQIEELLTNYGDIGILWFDGGGSFRNRDRRKLIEGDRLVELIRKLQPECLINDRLGFSADYGTPEQHIPESGKGTAFEVCMTLNKHWGYNRFDQEWKSEKVIVDNLLDIVSKGGNYLLNVRPTDKGKIPEASQKILTGVGKWIDKHEKFIYDAKSFGGRQYLRIGDNGKMMRNGDKIYLTFENWPEEGMLYCQGFKGELVEKVYPLGNADNELPIQRFERYLIVDGKSIEPDPMATVIVLQLKENASNLIDK